MLKKLNVGCGQIIKPGYVNLDIINLVGVDIVHDLNKFPYPFKENSFDEILCDSILEHVDDFIKVLKELHRIAKPGAVLNIAVPFWNSTIAWADPTHKRGFTLDTFTYFEKTNRSEGDKSYYFDFHFKVRKQRLVGTTVGKLLPEFFRRKLAVFINNIGEGVHVELEVVK